MKRISSLMVVVSICSTLLAAHGETNGFVVSWGASYGANKKTGRFTGLVTSAGQYLTNAIQVAAGTFHGVALDATGLVHGWGWNHSGRASVPSGLTNVIEVAAGGDFSLALTGEGHVVRWGEKFFGEYDVSPERTEAVRIVAASSYGLGLTRSGRVLRWPLAEEDSANCSNLIAVAVGLAAYAIPVGLREDGTVTLLRRAVYGDGSSPSAGLSNVVSIAAGSGHYLALMKDGTVFGWGVNYAGQATGIPTGSAENKERKASGLVVLDGRILTNAVSISASKNLSMALRDDGTLVAWGSNEYGRRDIPVGLSNVVGMAAGETFCLAITTNAAVAERFRR